MQIYCGKRRECEEQIYLSLGLSCFINQHATLVALGGVWSLWDAERAAGPPLLETCRGCYGGDEGLDFLWFPWFPIGRLYKVQKGLYTVSLRVRLRCGRGKRERRDAFEHKVSLPKLAEHGCMRGRQEGRARCCCRLGREYLLLCGERRGKKKKKKDWLGHWRHCMWEYLWYVLSRPAGGVIGLHITCLEWWECSHCKLKCCSNLQAIISGFQLHTYCGFFYFFSSVWIKENYW